MHRLCEVKSSDSAALILTVGSRRRAKCSLETPVVNGEVLEIEEKKLELLAAHAAGPPGHAARSSGFFSSISKTLTVATSTTTVRWSSVAAVRVEIKEADPDL